MQDATVTSGRRLQLAVGAMLLAGLFSILFGWLCDVTFGHETWSQFVLGHFGLVIGLPMGAALSFAIVVAFQQTAEGPVSLRFGPMEFTGPAGPILLWVVCFLATVLAIRVLTP